MDFSNPITLLIHDGELRDVRDLLKGLGVRFVERRGAPAGPDDQRSWDLVIATPQRMLGFEVTDPASAPTRIAVLAGDARTLRKMLKREAVDFTVRRPVHPEALRLLILHALYRGSEKRGVERVAVGAPIRFRIGWRWRRAILMDLSVRGCRLLSSRRVRRGDRMELNLPSDLTGHKPLTLTGRVMRRRTPVSDPLGSEVIAVRFEAGFGETARRLQATVERFASGPASLPTSIAKQRGAEDEAPVPSRGTTPPDRIDRRDALLNGASRAGTAAKEDATTERKPRGVRGDRRLYSRRVIALGDEIARVLIGRDLSVGGMRVEPHPVLSVGDSLRVALYARKGDQPLVVSAEVRRDDGDKGLALHFRDLSRAAKRYLTGMVDSLPYIEVGDDGESIVVSAILDRESR